MQSIRESKQFNLSFRAPLCARTGASEGGALLTATATSVRGVGEGVVGAAGGGRGGEEEEEERNREDSEEEATGTICVSSDMATCSQFSWLVERASDFLHASTIFKGKKRRRSKMKHAKMIAQ
jgi:hypothetical protein